MASGLMISGRSRRLVAYLLLLSLFVAVHLAVVRAGALSIESGVSVLKMTPITYASIRLTTAYSVCTQRLVSH